MESSFKKMHGGLSTTHNQLRAHCTNSKSSKMNKLKEPCFCQSKKYKI